jgi:hypothetical protein
MTMGMRDTVEPGTHFSPSSRVGCIYPAIGTTLAQSTVPIRFASHKPAWHKGL